MLNCIKTLVAFVVVVSAFSCGQKTQPYNKGINITPKPLELVSKNGKFILKKSTVFVAGNEALSTIADFFIAKINRATGYALGKSSEKNSDNSIELAIVAGLTVNDEGYLLDVSSNGIQIKAKTPQGIFYGMQTLMQLLPAEIESQKPVVTEWLIPCLSVRDEPRFKYRGQHLDVCRHFFDLEYIKKQMDVLAMFKINKFHWHLTDDQGWRIESKKYPQINRISTQRTEGEGNTYGPYFYTFEQIREIVAYARERFIEIIPEIELPGHGVAALAACPELSCTGGHFEVRNIWGVANDVYCAGNDATIAFLTDIIEEVIPLFDSKYFHIGGDECPKIRWEKCPKCQARIKQEKLKDEHELQSWVVAQIEKVLLKHNKKMIGWDEILEGGLATSATVMSWRGEQGGIDAANLGHDVIMTPGNWLYLDHYQGNSAVEYPTIGGYTTLEETYGYEPLPKGLDSNKAHHILGAQANEWTEYIHSPQHCEYMAFPRMIALAEVTWSAKEQRDYKDFERRIDNLSVRLDAHNINYHIPIPEQKSTRTVNHVAFIDSALIDLTTTRPMKIVYTLDGSEPDQNSAEYRQPFRFTANATLKVRSVMLSGKMSRVRTIEIEKQTYAPALSAEPTNVFKAEYYKGKHLKVAELNGKTPDETEQIADPKQYKYHVGDYAEVYERDLCSTVVSGYFSVPADGIYYLSSLADELWIDGKLQISNEGQLKKGAASDKTIALAKGVHAIKAIRLGNIIKGWPSQWDNSFWQISDK
ncbi:MAG: family 20 glycosylhydrolase [Prevotellaceae bacterium]|jgi:hexosaminidase|nr:family 20 glycosylhydrolase [Prevotellaceae bacterium]